jgi:hypothetical protein
MLTPSAAVEEGEMYGRRARNYAFAAGVLVGAVMAGVIPIVIHALIILCR